MQEAIKAVRETSKITNMLQPLQGKLATSHVSEGESDRMQKAVSKIENKLEKLTNAQRSATSQGSGLNQGKGKTGQKGSGKGKHGDVVRVQKSCGKEIS